jgi:hypothetical protein
VVKTGDTGVRHNTHALIYWLTGVVEDGIVIRRTSKTETGVTVLSTVEDYVGSIG